MYAFTITQHTLAFVKPAKTSRNVFTHRSIFLIELRDLETGLSGVGESAPLSLLSIDDVTNYEKILRQKLEEFCVARDLNALDLNPFPSIRFGIETALLNLKADEQGRIYRTPFTDGKKTLPINGLIWMNDIDEMYDEAITKIKDGFSVIKFKVGALDFDAECRMLEKLRMEYGADKITIRVDANGAFHPNEAMQQLKDLSRFTLHSIEQPIAAGQWDDMGKLCRESAVDIALDEELIGLNVQQAGNKVLRTIQPQYLILKPNLIGGVSVADDWIKIAQKASVKWWATSALEGNVGLNAIAQWVSTYPVTLHQGLGTGSLFSNNFASNLEIHRGEMSYQVEV